MAFEKSAAKHEHPTATEPERGQYVHLQRATWLRIWAEKLARRRRATRVMVALPLSMVLILHRIWKDHTISQLDKLVLHSG